MRIERIRELQAFRDELSTIPPNDCRLDINLRASTLGAQAIFDLLYTALTSNRHIHTLNITPNDSMQDARYETEGLGALLSLGSIRNLGYYGYRTSSESEGRLIAFLEALSSLASGTLETLTLGSILAKETVFTRPMIDALASLLKRPLPFHRLSLAYTSLDANGLSHLLRALMKSPSNLLHLDLEGNPLDASMMASLKNLLCRGSLRSLSLNSCALRTEHLLILRDTLSSPSNNITALDIGNNPLGIAIIQNLCSALESPNCQLEVLGLEANNLDYRCIEALAPILMNPLCNVRRLDLRKNTLGPAGLKSLIALGPFSGLLEILGLYYQDLEKLVITHPNLIVKGGERTTNYASAEQGATRLLQQVWLEPQDLAALARQPFAVQSLLLSKPDPQTKGVLNALGAALIYAGNMQRLLAHPSLPEHTQEARALYRQFYTQLPTSLQHCLSKLEEILLYRCRKYETIAAGYYGPVYDISVEHDFGPSWTAHDNIDLAHMALAMTEANQAFIDRRHQAITLIFSFAPDTQATVLEKLLQASGIGYEALIQLVLGYGHPGIFSDAPTQAADPAPQSQTSASAVFNDHTQQAYHDFETYGLLRFIALLLPKQGGLYLGTLKEILIHSQSPDQQVALHQAILKTVEDYRVPQQALVDRQSVDTDYLGEPGPFLGFYHQDSPLSPGYVPRIEKQPTISTSDSKDNKELTAKAILTKP